MLHRQRSPSMEKMGIEMNRKERELTETLGRSFGYQFRNSERRYDEDWQGYLAHREAWKEMEREIDSTTSQAAEIYNVEPSVVRPFIYDAPPDMQSMLDFVAGKLNRKPIHLHIFMDGRQAFWYQGVSNEEPPIAKAMKLGMPLEEYLYSYGAGWDMALRKFDKVQAKVELNSSLN